jgi:hypothetical protein
VTVRIAPELTPLIRDLDAFQPYPGNARNGDTDRIGRSLDLHGQYAPILVQTSTGFVIKGNHVYHSMLERGQSEAAVTLLDVSDDEALAIVIDDNATSDAGRYDHAALLALVERFGDDYSRTVWTEAETLDLLDRVERDAQTILDGAAGTDTPGSRGLGSAVVSYTLVFDNPEQQGTWYAFLKWLRQSGVAGDTIGERLSEYLLGVVPEDLR